MPQAWTSKDASSIQTSYDEIVDGRRVRNGVLHAACMKCSSLRLSTTTDHPASVVCMHAPMPAESCICVRACYRRAGQANQKPLHAVRLGSFFVVLMNKTIPVLELTGAGRQEKETFGYRASLSLDFVIIDRPTRLRDHHRSSNGRFAVVVGVDFSNGRCEAKCNMNLNCLPQTSARLCS